MLSKDVCKGDKEEFSKAIHSSVKLHLDFSSSDTSTSAVKGRLEWTASALANRAYSAAGQAGSALHTMVVLQVFQAKLLQSMDESGQDSDLALRTTKATVQATGKTMGNLVVLERQLWLNLTEIRDADKTAFLDSPVSPKGLFDHAVDGFAERFTAAQKTPTTQQPAKPALPQPQPTTRVWAAAAPPNG